MKSIVIKKTHACNKMNSSINVNEVIRAILNSLFFLKKRFLHKPKVSTAPKAQKKLKAQKTQKHKQAKNQKPQNRK